MEPIYHPPRSIAEGRQIANVLLVKGDETNYWLPIINLNRLLADQQNNRNNAFCYRCLRNLWRPEQLAAHMDACYKTLGHCEIMPTLEKAYKTFED